MLSQVLRAALMILSAAIAALNPSASYAQDGSHTGSIEEPFERPSLPRLTIEDQWALEKPVIFDLGSPVESSTSPASESEVNAYANPEFEPTLGSLSTPSMHTPYNRGQTVRVSIDTAGGERLTLQNQRHVTYSKNKLIFKSSTRTYEDVCTTPCTLDVAAGAYRLAAADADTWRRPRTLEISRRVVIDTDAHLVMHRHSRRAARAGYFTAMASSFVASIAVAMVSAIESRDPSQSLPPQRTPMMRATSFGLFAISGGFFVGGVMSRDNYKVDIEPPLETTPAP